MARVLAELLLLACVAAGVGYGYHRRDPCLGRCGEGTRCETGRCLAAAPTSPPSAPAAPAPKRKRRGTAAAADGTAAPEAQLKPGDTERVTQGDALGRPEHIDLTAVGPDAKELSQDDIDRVMHAAEGGIVRCITTAIGDAPLDEGAIEVGLRIEKDGRVSRLRVEGPRLLMQRGLHACVKSVLGARAFPVSGGATVASYPYAIR